MVLNLVLCPRCGGVMTYIGTYYDKDSGTCDVYVCRDCGYRMTYCVKKNCAFSG